MQDCNLKFHLEEKEKKEGGKKDKPKITPIDCDILIDLSPMNKVLQIDKLLNKQPLRVESQLLISNRNCKDTDLLLSVCPRPNYPMMKLLWQALWLRTPYASSPATLITVLRE